MVTVTSVSKETYKGILIDIAALAFIYFAPAFAHWLNFPVYMIEPMRLMLVLSMAHSTRKNSYLLALTLPLFSLVVSSHPEFYKMLVITSELLLNVFLFYALSARIKNAFLAMFPAIILSKLFCYLLYFIFFTPAFLRSEASTSFLVVQVITSVVFSFYIFIFALRKNRNK
jgi:hypothetical protein